MPFKAQCMILYICLQPSKNIASRIFKGKKQGGPLAQQMKEVLQKQQQLAQLQQKLQEDEQQFQKIREGQGRPQRPQQTTDRGVIQ